MQVNEQENYDVRIGRALRRLRERRGLTRVEVARRLGMKRSSSGQIARWERGKCSPRASALWRVLVAVDASFSKLHSELLPPSPARARLQEIQKELQAMAEGRPSPSRGTRVAKDRGRRDGPG